MSQENIDENLKVGDEIQNMEESIIPDLDAITNLKRQQQTDINIQVCNPSIRDEKFSKFIVYTIKGTDKDGTFEVIRRYKDFDKIRGILVIRWPGCYIPPLPPKQVSNMDSKFIEERKRQLNSFVKKVSELSYLYYSEEFQLFVRAQTLDLDKTLLPYNKVTSEEIIQRYSSSFTFLSGNELNNDVTMKIQSFRLFLQKTQGYFENFKKIAQKVTQARRNFYDQFFTFHNHVALEYERLIFTEYTGQSQTKVVFNDATNFAIHDHPPAFKQATKQPSLEYLYEWIKNESREIDAFIEAIDTRDKYEQFKNKSLEKQKSETAEMQKVLSGKTTMKTIFSRKNKEQEVKELEQSIALAGKEMENYTMVHDMTTLIIAYHEIEKFKGNKLEQYYSVVKLAAQNELNNVKHMAEYWNAIKANENVAEAGKELKIEDTKYETSE